jgi:tRNA(fMet)-specific endonuclease VapC
MGLIFGAAKSAVPEKKVVVVEEFLARLVVMNYVHHAAQYSGQLRAELQNRASP